MDVRVVDPSGLEPPSGAPVSARLISLAGARIAVLSNGKPNAGHVVGTVARSLTERFGAIVSLTVEKPNSSLPVSDEVLARLQDADAALVGVGD
jgi:hypothetical protein